MRPPSPQVSAARRDAAHAPPEERALGDRASPEGVALPHDSYVLPAGYSSPDSVIAPASQARAGPQPSSPAPVPALNPTLNPALNPALTPVSLSELEPDPKPEPDADAEPDPEPDPEL